MTRNFFYVTRGPGRALVGAFMATRNGEQVQHGGCEGLRIPVGADLFTLAVPSEHQDFFLIASRASDHVLIPREHTPPASIMPTELAQLGYRWAGNGLFASRVGQTVVTVWSGEDKICVPVDVVPASPANFD